MQFEIRNLTKRYKKVLALNDFTLTLEQGIYGILGPNGAGKSTLMNILTDNIQCDGGKILYDGNDIFEMGNDYKKIVGYMPQEQVGYPQFSAIEFLTYMAVLKGLDIKADSVKKQIMELIEIVNLTDVKDRKSGCFSGGMYRRLLLAQALLGEPKIVILDEPTAGLDPKERIAIRNTIAELAKDRIVLLATHIVSDIECIADKVILMKAGGVIQCESPSQLIQNMSGKVGVVKCTVSELKELQKKYSVSNVHQTGDGYLLHMVGDKLPYEADLNVNDINLEDVYLYHFGAISI